MAAQAENVFVVRILDQDLGHAPPYIVMEFCERGSLRSWVSAGRTWQDIAMALVHVLLGLNSIHEAGGFHRDLKPENLLLGTHPTVPNVVVVKVADWGLARAPGSTSPMTRHFGGTQGYIAPEVIAGWDYDSRSDVYSMGVVASELLTGDLSGQHLGEVAMPEHLRQVVRQMLARDPAVRPSASAIAQALQELLATPDVASLPEQRPEESDFGPLVFAGLLFGGALIALAALAGEDAPAPGPGKVPPR